MSSLEQRDLVAGSVAGGRQARECLGHPSPAMKRRHYRKDLRADGVLPAVGTVITTTPGAYWQVISASRGPERMELDLWALEPWSSEAHGPVTYLQGGVLS